MFALTSRRLCVVLNTLFGLLSSLLKAFGFVSLYKLPHRYFSLGYGIEGEVI